MHGAETVDGMAANPSIDFENLFVGQARIRFGDGHEFGVAVGPDAEGVIGKQARAPAVTGLGGDHHAIERVRLDFELPPQARWAAGLIR